jgi:hypothetical protein
VSNIFSKFDCVIGFKQSIGSCSWTRSEMKPRVGNRGGCLFISTHMSAMMTKIFFKYVCLCNTREAMCVQGNTKASA